MNYKPSTEERIWAVLAHLSSLTMGIGLPLPILGWSQNRRKSNYASYQSLQALGYQTLGYTIWILVALNVAVIQILDTLTKLIVAAESGADIESLTNMVIGGHFYLTFGLVALYFVLPVVAAIACALGMDFRYPLMGKRLAIYLGYDVARKSEEGIWLDEEHEVRWVAATGHFSVIIMLWGILAPIFAWVMHGKQSLFLRFQSVQTVLYQIGVMLLFLMSGFFYVFGFVAFLTTIGFSGNVAMDSTSSMIGAIVFLVSLLVAVLILLVIPLFHIMGQWAGYRLLKGDDFRYPILGKLVGRQLNKE